MNNAVFKKTIENIINIEILNFPRQKNQGIIYYNVFNITSISSKNEKSRGKFE